MVGSCPHRLEFGTTLLLRYHRKADVTVVVFVPFGSFSGRCGRPRFTGHDGQVLCLRDGTKQTIIYNTINHSSQTNTIWNAKKEHTESSLLSCSYALIHAFDQIVSFLSNFPIFNAQIHPLGEKRFNTNLSYRNEEILENPG